MRWTPTSEPQRTDSMVRLIEGHDSAELSPEEEVGRQTERAMDGFEEWLDEFREELTMRGLPAGR